MPVALSLIRSPILSKMSKAKILLFFIVL
ncbi:hypothetical protein Goarm_014833 [Gossypium armourianum]|uniref:Uncharacterized protein n=1 Tax=Gossypium armourianum TaxID=34283 RepID=A0A7J9J7C3_9ROSI|nr:hypothetical protein [Gossypium armourianum]